MEARRRDWRTVVLAIGASGGALLSLALVALLMALAVAGWIQTDTTTPDSSPLEVVVLVSALLLIGAVFVPAAYYSIQRLRGRDVPAATPKRLRIWQGILLIVAWIGAALGAQILVELPVVKWSTPLLYLLAIGIPAYFFVRLATGGLQTGSLQRYWGVLAAGVGLGTTLAMIAELLLALLGLIGLAVYVGAHPGQLLALQQLVQQVRNSGSAEQALELLSPRLNNPLAAIAALLFFSILSPLMEETTKSLAVWTVFDRLASPAQGFALGALSGAAFGLVESLLVSATPGPNWTTTLLVRGASTMMHILAASLTGWGIASFRLTKNPGRLIGMYLLAMGVHGLWNACVVAITFGGLRTASAPAGSDFVGMALIVAGLGVLVVLCLTIPLGLATANWRLGLSSGNAADAAPLAAAANASRGDVDLEVPWAMEVGDEAKEPEDDTEPTARRAG